jgi:hypothetical protein
VITWRCRVAHVYNMFHRRVTALHNDGGPERKNVKKIALTRTPIFSHPRTPPNLAKPCLPSLSLLPTPSSQLPGMPTLPQGRLWVLGMFLFPVLISNSSEPTFLNSFLTDPLMCYPRHQHIPLSLSEVGSLRGVWPAELGCYPIPSLAPRLRAPTLQRYRFP